MENYDDSHFAGGYTINYDLVIKQPEILAVTKLLATDIMRDGYVNVGEFFRNMSDADLNALNEQADQKSEASDLILISEMLATGEGLEQSTEVDQFIHRTGILQGFLAIESLKRKGFVKVHYDKLSFGDDMADSVIVEKI